MAFSIIQLEDGHMRNGRDDEEQKEYGCNRNVDFFRRKTAKGCILRWIGAFLGLGLVRIEAIEAESLWTTYQWHRASLLRHSGQISPLDGTRVKGKAKTPEATVKAEQELSLSNNVWRIFNEVFDKT